MLYLPGVTLEFHTIAVFVIVDVFLVLMDTDTTRTGMKPLLPTCAALI
jgi:hypothetical protein